MPEEPLPPSWPRLRRFVSKAAALLILSVTAAGSGALLTQGLSAPSIPYDASSLGAISALTIKAPRDYDVPDEESTRRKREAAAAEVRPVYDLDSTVLTEVDSRIRDAFASMRAALSAPEEGAEKPAAPPRDVEPLRQELVSKLQAPVESRDFESLVRIGFSAAAEQAELDLVGREMARMLVGERELLVTDERGIFVRPLPEGSPGGEVVTDLDSIRDLAAARADVERAAFDLQGDLPLQARRSLARLAQGALRPNLTYDAAETERRRLDAYRGVPPVVIQIKRGEKVVGAGDRIEPRHLLAFEAIRRQARTGDQTLARLAAGLLAGLLVFVAYRFGRHGLRRFQPRRRDALFLGVLLLSCLLALNGLGALGAALDDRFPILVPDALAFALPFAAGAMVVRLVLPAESALLFALISSSLYGLLEGTSLAIAIYALAGSIVGADRAARSQDRSGILRAGLFVGLTNALVIGCFEAFVGRLWSVAAAQEMALGFGGGALLCPMIALAVIPLVEGVFGYTTDARLLELANLNHPALKELIVKAPGTYHHSIILGALAEAAAEAIGGNALLARVSAYYHDLGKGKNPLYFAENQKGQNRHDALPPEESAAIVRQHVADGLELARQYKLPKAVADAIPQHHGTRLIGFFYQKALRLHGAPLSEEPYRYLGPKPRSREAALVMLADGVEAASRSLPQASPEAVGSLVQKVVDSAFADGQLDDCDLTLRDLTAVARSFRRTLENLHHGRPSYPPDSRPAPRPGLPLGADESGEQELPTRAQIN